MIGDARLVIYMEAALLILIPITAVIVYARDRLSRRRCVFQKVDTTRTLANALVQTNREHERAKVVVVGFSWALVDGHLELVPRWATDDHDH